MGKSDCVGCRSMTWKRGGQRVQRCPDCNREHSRAYRRTSAGRQSVAMDRQRSGLRVLMAKLARVSCVDCGLAVTVENSVAFDFDHRDRSQKIANVSRLSPMPMPFAAEIEKCDLRCAICHRLKTKREGDAHNITRVPVEPVEPMDVLF